MITGIVTLQVGLLLEYFDIHAVPMQNPSQMKEIPNVTFAKTKDLINKKPYNTKTSEEQNLKKPRREEESVLINSYSQSSK